MKYINKNNLKDNITLIKEPFEHIVIDNFLHEEYLNLILSQLDNLTIDKSYYYGSKEYELNKYAFKNNFDTETQEIFKELNSDEFITYVEKITGVTGLIRNNLELHGAGIHKVFNEGFLTMHTDFEGYNHQNIGLLDRRINLLLYMNPDWKDDYKGELCLYDRHRNSITKKIKPILNRCVIFLTPNNIHGHPEPLNLPINKSRQAFATYYYTKNTTKTNLYSNNFTPVMWYYNIR